MIHPGIGRPHSGSCFKGSAATPAMASKKRIVYQGEPGANSDLASRKAYPAYMPVPCATFEDCFAAVRNGTADLAMIPIENSVAGRVADIHHLMPNSGLHIVAEHFMPVRHQLLAPRGATLKSIETVESHVHALGQCRKIIRSLGIRPVVAADTAGSAREVSGGRRHQPCGHCLGTGGEDLRARDSQAQHRGRGAQHDPLHRACRRPRNGRDHSRKQKVVTTFVFQVRNIPAALYKALGGFATNGVNMTKLESYMVGGSFNQTQFYADVEGHPQDRALELALEELGVLLPAQDPEDARRLSCARHAQAV